MSARKLSAKKGRAECHWFKLSPLFQSCKIKPIAVDFTPLPQPPTSIVPTYTKNSLEMAPTFMLPACPPKSADLKHYSQQLHVRRILQDQNSSMYLPRPKPESICQLCREEYNDYIAHILDEKHKKAIQASPFQKEIYKLVRKVRREKRERQRSENNTKGQESDKPTDERKRKLISKENSKA